MNRPGFVGAALALLAIAAPTFAQDEDETITITTGWEKGDQICFQLVKSRTMTRGGFQLPATTATSHNSLEIIDANEEEFVVRWTVHDIDIQSPIPMNDLLKRLTTLTTEHPMEFVFGREAIQLMELRNFDDVKAMLDETMSELTPLLRQTGLPESQLNQMTSGVMQLFSDKTTAAVMLSQDITGMFLPYGYELFVEYGTVIETAIANPAGGDPLPATETWYVTMPDPAESDVIAIEWIQEMQPETLVRFSRELLAKTGQDAAIEGVEDAMQHIEMVREAYYEYDPKRELFTRSILVNENHIFENGRTEVWEWTVVDCDEKH